MALLWTGALVRPFYKANLLDIRPIRCSEALVKLAMGTTVDGLDLQTGMGPQQFGGGKGGGAHLEVEQIRAAAALQPDRALVSLDVENACGSVEWADALEVALDNAPAFAPALASMWAPGRIHLYTQQQDGTWAQFPVFGGLFQGGCDGHPCFCLVIGTVLAQVLRASGSYLEHMLVWLYVDDIVAQVRVGDVCAFYRDWETAMRKYHLRLKQAKCRVHIPQYRGRALPPDVKAAAQPLVESLPGRKLSARMRPALPAEFSSQLRGPPPNLWTVIRSWARWRSAPRPP